MDSIKKVSIILFCGTLIAFFLAFLVLPKNDYSKTERRYLSSLPAISLQSLADGTLSAASESFLSDHFPGRNFFVGLYNYLCTYSGRNGESGVYWGKAGFLLAAPVAGGAQLEENLKQIRRFAEDTDIPTDLMVVPSAGAILREWLPSNHLAYGDAELLREIPAQCGDAVQTIHLYPAFASHPQKSALYLQTDHHWTSAGAYLAYQVYCREKGFCAQPESAFSKQDFPGFYGTNYAKSGLWLHEPDTLALWLPPQPVSVEIYDDDGTMAYGDSPFYPGAFDGPNPYGVYFDGDHSLVRIRNAQGPPTKLLLIKDSYANAFAPFLSGHYGEIDMVDLRYFRRTKLSDFVRENEIDAILFLYSLPQLARDSNLLWLQ